MNTQSGILEIYEGHDVSISGHFISLEQQNVFNPSSGFAASVLVELWDQFGRDEAHPLAEILDQASRSINSDLLKPYIQKVTFDSPQEASTRFEIIVKDSSLVALAQGGEQWNSSSIG